MSQKNDNFFNEKKEWSEVKDELLGCYFKPYFAKIIHARYPILYVDCFAGKGKFDDGKDGSPLIALEIIDNVIESSNAEIPPIATFFIDLNYAEDLRNNLPKPNYRRNIQIIDGKFEDNIELILSKAGKANVFLYIDPYGIKALNVKQLCSFINKYSLKGVEVLINFNSFGFYRQACNVLNVKIDKTVQGMSEFLIEYDTSNVESEEDLNTIFGSNSWKDIVTRCRNGKITAFQAEIELSNEFCRNLTKGFKYVLNMPIRRSTEINPKYRMVHATNHADGCLLMADNMYSRSEESRIKRMNGQMSMFELDVNDRDIMFGEKENNLLEILTHEWIECRDLFCNYYLNYGVTTNTSGLFQILKDNENKIEIRRNPAISEKTGKPTRFWSFGKGNKIYVRMK